MMTKYSRNLPDQVRINFEYLEDIDLLLRIRKKLLIRARIKT